MIICYKTKGSPQAALYIYRYGHSNSIYFLCAEVTPQAYKLCAVTRERLHLQGVPSPQTVHRTVWGFTLCEAPSYYFAVFKAENGDQRRRLWTLARDNIPCIPFHAAALYEADTLLSLILIESKCCFPEIRKSALDNQIIIVYNSRVYCKG